MASHLSRIANFIRRFLRLLAWLFLLALLLESSSVPPSDKISRLRKFTRPIEFDFISWTLDAIAIKISQFSLGTPNYLSVATRKQAVLDTLDLVEEIQRNEAQLYDIYADPNIEDPLSASAPLRETCCSFPRGSNTASNASRAKASESRLRSTPRTLDQPT